MKNKNVKPVFNNAEEELVNEVIEDFKARQLDRKMYETNWKLNINFFIGNQYCMINAAGDIVEYDKQFHWQEREVFNHIAPLVETRLSKLSKVRPSMTVVPFSDSTDDITCARVSKNILKAASYKLNLSSIISNATVWSEICGTSFYKVLWNSKGGNVVGKSQTGEPLHEGDVSVTAVSPFEIFPDSNHATTIEDCKSIIHAKVYSTHDIKEIWGQEVEGADVDVFTLDTADNIGGIDYRGRVSKVARHVKHNSALVIERYERPSRKHPNGRLIIVAGNKLLYNGELPFTNDTGDQRGIPFIRQCSIKSPSCFWGISIIERCIPIQRAFNTIKNRKHEFLNRISMGVMAVEDGSIDTDNLEEEGLSPGKVIVYRQGGTPPRLISAGSVPTDFTLEEDRLLNEFLTVSGVSDLLRGSLTHSSISGVALQLLIEQDEVRLIASAEEIRESVKAISKQILRFYKKYATWPHASRLIGENGSIEMFYWNNTDIGSDDVVFETENEINESIAQKRSMLFDVFNAGLLHDEGGKLSNTMRYKLLDQLGFGIWETGQDMKSLQIKQAGRENLQALGKAKLPEPKEIDDHALHINEHICFMLSDEYLKEAGKETEEKMLQHIRLHKQHNAVQQEIETRV